MTRTGRTQLKGGFAGCTWCHGRGCMCCDNERQRAIERAQQPILSFTCDELEDPGLGPLIKDAIGADALRKAFGPEGGGVAEIEFKCAIVSLVQAMRKRGKDAGEGDAEDQG